MITLKLRWFTDIETLKPAGRCLLATFFNRFREDLASCDIHPPCPDSLTPHYFFQVATMLKARSQWPASFESKPVESGGVEIDPFC